jgi:hypothetical protein
VSPNYLATSRLSALEKGQFEAIWNRRRYGDGDLRTIPGDIQNPALGARTALHLYPSRQVTRPSNFPFDMFRRLRHERSMRRHY